jgi:hypothetical protein
LYHYIEVSLEGRTAYKLMWSPLWFAMNQVLEPSSLRFELKSLEIIDADADPLSDVAYPPRADAPGPPRTATCAVGAVQAEVYACRFRVVSRIASSDCFSLFSQLMK